MAGKSAIEWTESTWNPVTGCTKISTGCKNCYAERMAKRLQAMGQLNYRNGFRPTCHQHVLDLPLHWKKPQMIFVNSMSDLFHKQIPKDFVLKIFATMNKAPQHTFQILTKRATYLEDLSSSLPWSENIWMGVTVENSDYKERINSLRRTGAYIKFLSLEPLLGDVGVLNLEGIDWVIVGGESGPKARPIKARWVHDIQEQCKEQNVSFFFKQWGGINKKKNGRLLDGQTWDELPKKVFEALYA
jgi:protein gp37